LPNTGSGLPAAFVSPYIKSTTAQGLPLYGQADLLGNEVFCPITITGVVNGVTKDLKLPYAVIGMKRVKVIIETEMTELNGSVDEIISNKDFEIDIKGFLIGQYEQFPDTDLAALEEMCAVNNTVQLKSTYSDIFLKSNLNILIKEMVVPAKPKVIGVRDFSILAKSSSIFTLYQS
ncbi:DUF6046 domain-containing protein, partial [uncultured Mucilaginibacter sp.]|uniref:DUF6046 domain-containing protein n=1 Tax=uncultured Mucilaginibacter sp. TaxID=797541 RepID=UPI0025F0A5F0